MSLASARWLQFSAQSGVAGTQQHIASSPCGSAALLRVARCSSRNPEHLHDTLYRAVGGSSAGRCVATMPTFNLQTNGKLQWALIAFRVEIDRVPWRY